MEIHTCTVIGREEDLVEGVMDLDIVNDLLAIITISDVV
jgi:hypothetical protein